MTSLERVRSAIHRTGPDRIPLHEDFWIDTPEEWRKQGLAEYLELKPPADPHISLDNWLEDYFDFDIAVMFLDASPRLPQTILGEDDEWITFSDRWGYTAKKPRGRSGTIEYQDTHTKEWSDWLKIVDRFVLDPSETARIDDRNYFEHFEAYPEWQGAQQKYMRLRNRNRYILFKDYGPWEGLWRHREFTRALIDIALNPEQIAEMTAAHHKLRQEILDLCIASGMKPDGVFLVDDLGSSNGPLISPDSFRKYFKPLYADLGSWLKERGIDFWLHCCGNTEMFFDDYIECGVKVINPLQVSAGLDIIKLNQSYGNQLAFYGNIDAHLLDGDQNQLHQAIRARKKIFSDGGWICHSDHSVPPTMAYRDYQRFLEIMRTD
jgi:uroporphyrinogen decarboxylase